MRFASLIFSEIKSTNKFVSLPAGVKFVRSKEFGIVGKKMFQFFWREFTKSVWHMKAS